VTVTVDPEATVELETVIVEVERLAGPGTTCTVGIVVVTVVALIVALIVVADPEASPVKVAV
jgi:hypothetical protein